MARTKSFFSGGLKFNLVSVKNNHNYKKSILNVSLDARCATSPAAQQHRTRQYCIWTSVCLFQLYNYFEDNNYVYLVIEMCHNGELQRYLRTNCKVLSEDEGTQ